MKNWLLSKKIKLKLKLRSLYCLRLLKANSIFSTNEIFAANLLLNLGISISNLAVKCIIISFDCYWTPIEQKKMFFFVPLSLNPLSANPTKWPNTLKQFVSKLQTNCLSLFDDFVRLALKGLKCSQKHQFWKIRKTQPTECKI